MTIDNIQYKIHCREIKIKYPRAETRIDLSAEYTEPQPLTNSPKTWFIDLPQSLESETVQKIFQKMDKFLKKNG